MHLGNITLFFESARQQTQDLVHPRQELGF